MESILAEIGWNKIQNHIAAVRPLHINVITFFPDAVGKPAIWIPLLYSEANIIGAGLSISMIGINQVGC